MHPLGATQRARRPWQPLQPRTFWHCLDRLADTEVAEHILRCERSRVSVCALYKRHDEAYLRPEARRTARSCDTTITRQRVRTKQVRCSRHTYVLNHTAHASLGDTAATEYLHGVASGVLRGACRGHLQQTDWTRE